MEGRFPVSTATGVLSPMTLVRARPMETSVKGARPGVPGIMLIWIGRRVSALAGAPPCHRFTIRGGGLTGRDRGRAAFLHPGCTCPASRFHARPLSWSYPSPVAKEDKVTTPPLFRGPHDSDRPSPT